MVLPRVVLPLLLLAGLLPRASDALVLQKNCRSPVPAPSVAMRPAVAARHAHVLLQEDGFDTKALTKDADERMKKTVSSVTEKLATLRVGRASADMLDRVMVTYYETPTPLNQLASVSTPTAQQLVVDPYDKSVIGDIERALIESDVGMTPNNDGSVIRLNVPTLTAERRKELAKTAKGLGEEGKVALRNIRRDAIDKVKKMQKDGLGEDESKAVQGKIDKSIKKAEGEVEGATAQREKEITTL